MNEIHPQHEVGKQWEVSIILTSHFMNPAKYIPLVQKPECCAVTCLQMILYRRTGKLYDQQSLAEFFGVKIHEKNTGAFNVPLQVMKGYNIDEGISTLDSISQINAFFTQESLNLTAKSYLASEIANLEVFIAQELVAGNDLWVEYHNNEIHPTDKVRAIHDSLVESFDADARTVVLVDPEYMHAPRITVTLDTLQDAISAKFGKETGFVCVRE